MHNFKFVLALVLSSVLTLCYQLSIVAADNSFPSFGLNGSNIVAAWRSTVNGVSSINGARKLSGGTWNSSPIVLSGSSSNVTSNPLIVVNSSSNAFIVWQEDDPNFNTGILKGSIYTSSLDSWLTTPFNISSTSSDSNGGNFMILMDNLGNLRAVWNASINGNRQIFYGTSTFNNPTTWSVTQVSN